MKHSKFFAVLPISFLLIYSSCKKSELPETNLASDPVGTSRTAARAAQVYKYQSTVDLAEGWNEFNACTGNLVDITSGIWHINFSYTINDNRFTFIDHSNVSKYKLKDLTTGIEYVGSYVSNYSETEDITTGFPIEVTNTLKILLTTPGGGNNGILFVDFHGTLTANGIEAVFFDNYRAGCQ